MSEDKIASEIAHLLRKARRSIHAAVLLMEGEEREFAVSRIYYAIFYAVEALLLSDGVRLHKHSAGQSTFGLRYV